MINCASFFENISCIYVRICFRANKPKEKADFEKWPNINYFAIFDGHAGNKCSEYLKNNLEEFLTKVRKNKDYKQSFANFQELLIMWTEFYNYRSKDSVSLQHSTKISFNLWKKVTTILLDKDPKNKMSLYYNEDENK